MKKMPFNSLMVPTDFSENAWRSFQQALLLVDGEESEIVVVHAIDPGVVNSIAELGFGDHDSILASMRASALERLKAYSSESTPATNVDTLVCEGEPFFEIIKKARDFAVDAIVMSRIGQRNQAKSLLFGSTAEKVIRGCDKPVIVLPPE
jgi:nucleotide-binding universal stress UspA family protein